MNLEKRAQQIYDILIKHYGKVEAELDYRNLYELTIAVVLSAQTTDKQVNKATPLLFEQYPDFPSLAKAEVKELEEIIRSTGFYKNKAKNILALAKALGPADPPDTIEELIKLPGIGRKTANVIISQGHGKPGFAVDTHVGRISRRLELTINTNPDKVEQDLKSIFKPETWLDAHLLLINHGRALCTARSPKCSDCPLKVLCNSQDKQL